MKEECGVVGVYRTDPTKNCARFIYYGLFALQHRGQENAGIAVNSGGCVEYHKGMGLLSEVFKDRNPDDMSGHIGIGHVRYSTAGDSLAVNAQPLVVNYKAGQIALAHNGNLVNANALRNMLEDDGVIFQTTTDTEVIVNLLARSLKHGTIEAIKRVVEIIKGAYALVLTLGDDLIGIRDPHGWRPLCIGKTDTSYVLASESCALDAVGAEFVRDVENGEIVVINENGLQSFRQNNWIKKRSCIFELIYFARPDSVIDGVSVYGARHKAGAILWEESGVDSDIVIGVPDSGIPAAIGYSEKSGIPYALGLIKNKYTGRTFIQPDQKLREEGVQIKLNALKEVINGKRVTLIDDSIVRGTTAKRLVETLRSAGAKEVHFRVSSPPVKHTCHFGIDTPSPEELIANKMTAEEIGKRIEADSLSYLSIPGLLKSVGDDCTYCQACFDGDYPIEVPLASQAWSSEIAQSKEKK